MRLEFSDPGLVPVESNVFSDVCSRNTQLSGQISRQRFSTPHDRVGNTIGIELEIVAFSIDNHIVERLPSKPRPEHSSSEQQLRDTEPSVCSSPAATFS